MTSLLSDAEGATQSDVLQDIELAHNGSPSSTSSLASTSATSLSVGDIGPSFRSRMHSRWALFKDSVRPHAKLLRSVALVVCVLLILALLLILVIPELGNSDSSGPRRYLSAKPPVSGAHGAVSVSDARCSAIGVAIMRDHNGNAVDAAVAAALCQGVVQPQSSGVGGGGVLTLWLPNGTYTVLDFREQAPAAAGRDMYVANPSLSQRGALSIAVPGELAGLYEAQQRWGRAAWSDVVMPAVQLARDGFAVSGYLARALSKMRSAVLSDPGMREVFTRNGDGATLVQVGDVVRWPRFAETLAQIAANGVDIIYDVAPGSIGEQLVGDIQAAGGIITAEDVRSYRTVERVPAQTFWHGVQLIAPPAPFSGSVLMLAANILEGFNFCPGTGGFDARNATIDHLIAESLRFAYADRQLLGDPAFVPSVPIVEAQMQSKSHAASLRQRISRTQSFPYTHYTDLSSTIETTREDHGTLHISAVDASGVAVGLTTTVNLYFGSCFMSPSTGILLNDQMDDFSTPNVSNAFDLPPSVSNFIVGGKRPQSSMSPTIVIKNNRPFMVTGAAGGRHAAARHLWLQCVVAAFCAVVVFFLLA